MNLKSIILLLFLASVFACSGNKEVKENESLSTPGGWSESEITPEIEGAVEYVISEMNTNAKLDKIISAKSQIVKGFNYDIDFLLDNGETWNAIVYRDLDGNYSMNDPASLK